MPPLTIKEAAKRLEVSIPTVRRKIKDGELYAEKKKGPYGNQWFIDEDALEEYRSGQAEQIYDVVEVNQAVDKEELIAIIGEALEKRDQHITERLDRIEKKIDDREKINDRDQKLMEVIREIQDDKQKSKENIIGRVKSFLGL